MKNKKNFNNLFDSILCTILLLVHIAFYALIILFGVIDHKEGTNPIATLISSSIFFGLSICAIIFLIIKECYGYWILLENSILLKKLFSKKIIIEFAEIEKVEKKIVTALIFSTFQSEAYIIFSDIKKIIILTKRNKKAINLLEEKISKYISC